MTWTTTQQYIHSDDSTCRQQNAPHTPLKFYQKSMANPTNAKIHSKSANFCFILNLLHVTPQLAVDYRSHSRRFSTTQRIVSKQAPTPQRCASSHSYNNLIRQFPSSILPHRILRAQLLNNVHYTLSHNPFNISSPRSQPFEPACATFVQAGVHCFAPSLASYHNSYASPTCANAF